MRKHGDFAKFAGDKRAYIPLPMILGGMYGSSLHPEHPMAGGLGGALGTDIGGVLGGLSAGAAGGGLGALGAKALGKDPVLGAAIMGVPALLAGHLYGSYQGAGYGADLAARMAQKRIEQRQLNKESSDKTALFFDPVVPDPVVSLNTAQRKALAEMEGILPRWGSRLKGGLEGALKGGYTGLGLGAGVGGPLGLAAYAVNPALGMTAAALPVAGAALGAGGLGAAGAVEGAVKGPALKRQNFLAAIEDVVLGKQKAQELARAAREEASIIAQRAAAKANEARAASESALAAARVNREKQIYEAIEGAKDMASAVGRGARTAGKVGLGLGLGGLGLYGLKQLMES